MTLAFESQTKVLHWFKKRSISAPNYWFANFNSLSLALLHVLKLMKTKLQSDNVKCKLDKKVSECHPSARLV